MAEDLPAPRSAEETPTQVTPAQASGPDPPPAAPGPKHKPAFAPGELLAERYRVVRFIARGGMGEVYEVEDLTLRGHVALKTIRSEIASSPAAVERFKREISIARRITHPNVSRIYDIGVHHGVTDTLFLTMELLCGETLLEHVARRGTLSEAEALPIAEQIAAGLAAAHEAGVIHRDFKSANVVLVPSAHGVRAVVADFGLARPAAAEDGMASLSEAGAVVGTPAYMAPEQVEGRELTPAADIYAFGIVLYEMVTGHRPFVGDTPLSLAVKHLTESPVPPVELQPSLAPIWNACILRCLERDPFARFATALDVTRALRGDALPPVALRPDTMPTVLQFPAQKTPAPARRRIGMLLGACLAAALAIYGIVSWSMSRSQPERVASPLAAKPQTVALRRAVAVLPLHNDSGREDAAWLSTAIAELLSADLAAGETLRVASPHETARLHADLGVADFGTPSPDTLRRIRTLLHVDSIVTGSYALVGDPGSHLFRVELRLLDGQGGNVLASTTTSGTEGQLFDLVSRADDPLRQKLGLRELSPGQSLEVEASIPSNPETLRLYTTGVARLRQFDAQAALDALTPAVSADEQNPFIRAAFCEAYAALGYEAKAKEQAGRALALSGRLSREQKLQIAARVHAASRQWEQALEAERFRWEAAPDNLDYGLSLANAQISAEKTREALVTIEALRRLPEPLSGDGRIDLAEARAHGKGGDFERQKALAVRAASKGRTSRSRLLVANARMLEATAQLSLGDSQAASSATDEARSLFEAAGDRGAVARALELTAAVVDRRGDLEGEKRLLEQALAMHTELGDQASAARVSMNLGTVFIAQGRPESAEKSIDGALAAFRRAGAKSEAAIALNAVGALMFNRGDLRRAEQRYREALTLFSELGDKTGTPTALTNIAEVLECRGNIDDARRMHEEALASYRASGDQAGIAYVLFRLGGIFAVRGELVAARERYQEALSIQSRIGDGLGAADSRVALAELWIEQGKAAEAETTAREAEEILRTEGASDRSAYAQGVIADALRVQRRDDDARQAAQRAWAQAEKSEDRRVRYKVAISKARAMAAAKNPTEVEAALQLLKQTIEDATRMSFVVSAYEAQLASAEIELSTGRPTAKTRLGQLAREATARGFGWIARRAAAGAA